MPGQLVRSANRNCRAVPNTIAGRFSSICPRGSFIPDQAYSATQTKESFSLLPFVQPHKVIRSASRFATAMVSFDRLRL